ncbi:MAG: SAM-dependent chlorinase/fluorinase [Brevefilum sp.]
MKITVIADVHGNLPALEAVLRHARGQGGGEMILNLGDLTGYGPLPEAVVRWSQSPGVISILGDYDKKVVSKAQGQEGWSRVKTAHKREMFTWTYRALSKRSRKYLRSLPKRLDIVVEDVRISLSHGSPAAHQEFIGPETPEVRLAELAAETQAKVNLSGHTHRAFYRQVGDVLFVNPGSVGRPDDGDPRASYALLEIEGGHVGVQHFRVPYDIMAAVSGLRMAGLPEVFAQVIRRGLNYDDVAAELGMPLGSVDLEPSGVVSLLTDFSLDDHFVGVMKGVIAGIAPQAIMLDITHQVRPQNIAEGARLLAEAVPYFPQGTVHVAVVDPGVGTQRRALAAQIGAHFFVAPDNGLLSRVLEQAKDAGLPVRWVALTNSALWLPEASTSFHGRDVFAPVGAHLANGMPLRNLGEEINDPVLLSFAQPVGTSAGWQAEVVLIDRFGNLSTNLPGAYLHEGKQIVVRVGDETIQGLSPTFGAASPGALIAFIDSTGHLAIAEVNGDAARRLDINTGAVIIVEIEEK